MLSKNLEVALVDFSSMGALEYADLKAMQRTFDNPQELQNLFDAAIQVIFVSMHNALDGKTGRSRGFAFIYFESVEDAKVAKEAMSDQEIDGRRVRVDFSITKRAHTPTPGVYMGQPTYRGRDNDRSDRYRDRGGYDRRGGGGYGGGT